jgi:predicted RNA binding protein YcfA (HicA-like mRNA interferase family)
MPVLGPVKRSDLVSYMRELGFKGPYAGGKHQFMIKGQLRVRIPNPHGRDIGKWLLKQLLEEAEIDIVTWESLR